MLERIVGVIAWKYTGRLDFVMLPSVSSWGELIIFHFLDISTDVVIYIFLSFLVSALCTQKEKMNVIFSAFSLSPFKLLPVMASPFLYMAFSVDIYILILLVFVMIVFLMDFMLLSMFFCESGNAGMLRQVMFVLAFIFAFFLVVFSFSYIKGVIL